MIAHTYLGSITTALPNVRRSGGRCSSIQEKAEGEMGRRRNMEPWFSQRKSAVGEVPDATNESLCEDIMPPSGEDSLEIMGRTKVGFAPYRPYPFFRRLAPWPFGSVAGRLKLPPLVIPDDNNLISL
jgi:hypothetical protein